MKTSLFISLEESVHKIIVAKLADIKKVKQIIIPNNLLENVFFLIGAFTNFFLTQ